MTTNNAESWAAEMDRTEPYSAPITSEGEPEGFLNPKPLAEVQKNNVAEVQKNNVVEGPEGTLDDESLAEVQKINLNTEVRRQGPEVASSIMEEVLDSVVTEVGLTGEHNLVD